MSIVREAFAYYDKNERLYKDLKQKIGYVKYAQTDQDDIEGVRLVLSDKSGGELFITRVEVLGRYQPETGAWTWAWALPDIDKSITASARGVLSYGTELDIQKKETRYANILLRDILLSSSSVFCDDTPLEICLAVASYLTKNAIVLRWDNSLSRPGEFYGVNNEMINDPDEITHYVFLMDGI